MLLAELLFYLAESISEAETDGKVKRGSLEVDRGEAYAEAEGMPGRDDSDFNGQTIMREILDRCP